MGHIQQMLIIQNLVKSLNLASKAYYDSGNPIMDDAEYDIKLEELKRLEQETNIVLSNSPTQNPGYIISDKINKIDHDHPMLSLDKCHTKTEVLNFINGKKAYASVKLDGNSISAKYENGELVSLESRGNGITGNDLMIHKNSFDNLPLKIPYKKTYVIDGECIITKSDFEAINANLSENTKFANSRNTVSGTLSLLDPNISKTRHLKFIGWNVIEGDPSNSHIERLKNATNYGFICVPTFFIPIDESNIDEVLDFIKKIAEQNEYPMDGAVITFDNIEYGKSLGRTNKFFRNAIAYKYEDEVKTTKLKDIEWSMGKNKLTPVAIFDAVDLDGTIVNRASLHNCSILKNLKLGIGDHITVYKSNCIIPQIKNNLTKSNSYKIPTACPYCNSPVEIIKENESEELICTNNNCFSKIITKISHFTSRNAANIENLSNQILMKLYELNFVKSIKDLYSLKDHYEELINIKNFGKKSIDNLLGSIENSKNITLDKFIYSLSIEYLGFKNSKLISDFIISSIQNPDKEKIINFIAKNNSIEFWSNIKGIGEKAGKSFYNFCKSEEMESYFSLFNIIIEKKEIKSTLSNLNFVITGSVENFKSRRELQNYIEALDGKILTTISPKVNYLINNNINSNSSKNKKAKELNIKIITEKEFLELAKQGGNVFNEIK